MAAKKKTKKKLSPKFYYCEVWKMNYFYFIGWRDKDFSDYLISELDLHRDFSLSDGACLMIEVDGIVGNYIWTRDINKPETYAHECVHAANNTMVTAKCAPDFVNDESYCYLVENIFKQGLK